MTEVNFWLISVSVSIRVSFGGIPDEDQESFPMYFVPLTTDGGGVV